MAFFSCKNYGSCTNADSRETLELAAGQEPVCPECGFQLESLDEDSKHGSTNRKFVFAGGVIVLAMASFAGIWWVKSGTGTNANAVATVTQLPKTGGLTPDAASLKKEKEQVDRQILQQAGSGAGSAQAAVIAKEYVKASIPLMQLGKWIEADAQLQKAKDANPNEPLVYVNQAIVHLKLTRTKEAMKDLQTAFEKGFRDIPALERDSDLKPLVTTEEFRALVAKHNLK